MHLLLPVWLQKTWGPWTAYGGGGYGINPGAGLQNYGFVGGVLQCQVAKPVLIGAEVYHQTASEVGGRDETAFNVGTVIDLSEMHHLLFSAGCSINGPTDFQCYFAYQFTFDNSLFGLGNARRSDVCRGQGDRRATMACARGIYSATGTMNAVSVRKRNSVAHTSHDRQGEILWD